MATTGSFLIDTLQQLGPVSKADKAIYLHRFQVKHYRKGDFFLQEGQVCKYMGLVESGLLRYYINQDGKERSFSFLHEKRFLCNYESFITQAPSTRIIQALEDTTVHVANYEDFQYIFDHTQSGDRIGRLVLGMAFIKLEKDLASFYTDTPEQRYQRFIEEYPQLQQRISQYHIASFVGVKPPSLSRIRKRIFESR
ncbi:Crp/Fnr family transcriptional regulator [Chitinophaga nivalis]|uniref:Crp/Fnr family transcriptional regulator n=1 Tax=Chitinophaga nivalis TaxID=2991709 RepID=A0ABT3IJQ4_9BACT|nr:Crp/Fnr family transcriptional regulator [Chitinophaga nivalis]MCW3466113.1 Crp/Fnr family transcriptional regulator [Chitinophaga nivalis]MCW3484196.1 Crp/Fnr family transcriptional regulator [Chitinophaga nivalis]